MQRSHLLTRLLAVAATVPFAIAAQPRSASAACITGALPSASVSGVVVSTSIDPSLGVIVAVKADDGATTQVAFWGRNPTNTLGGVENTVEDAWAGSLPEVGGRYNITGDFNGAKEPLTVSNCSQSPAVEVLSAPPASTAPERTAGASDHGGTPTSVLVGLAVGAAAVLVALWFFLRRRPQPAPE